MQTATTAPSEASRNGILTTLGATIGLAFGPSVIANLTVTGYITPIEREFGWSRVDVSFAFTLVAYMIVIMSPLQGFLVDRFGPRRVVLTSIPLFALSLAAIFFTPANMAVYYVLWAIVPIAGLGLWPLGYLQAVTPWFDRKLGLALGCALAGLRTKVVGVVVFSRLYDTRGRWARMARRVNRLLVSLAETAIFVGLLVPAEATVLVAAFLAGRGVFAVEAIFAAAFAGGLIGDQIGYLLGRFGGARIAARGGRLGRLWRRYEQATGALFRRRSALAVTLARFISFVRTLMPWFAGMTGMSYGRFLVYETENAKTLLDVWLLPLTGDRKPIPFLQTEFGEGQGRLSPDSRWLAYVSNETGRNEVYLQPFPRTGDKRKVSTEGGAQPRWRADGKGLYYVAPAANGLLAITAVDVQTREANLELGTPKPLFSARFAGTVSVTQAINSNVITQSYAASADGQRFYLLSANNDVPPEPITVVLNWQEELKQRVPTR